MLRATGHARMVSQDPIHKIGKERFLIFPLACDLVLAAVPLLLVFKSRRYPDPIRIGSNCTNINKGRGADNASRLKVFSMSKGSDRWLAVYWSHTT